MDHESSMVKAPSIFLHSLLFALSSFFQTWASFVPFGHQDELELGSVPLFLPLPIYH